MKDIEHNLTSMGWGGGGGTSLVAQMVKNPPAVGHDIVTFLLY